MSANHQKTLDDMEPVLKQEQIEKTSFNKLKACSCKGRQLYEKIQEQKNFEAFENDWWGDGVQE